ncbi:hypothetical protein K1719_006255 [Acacia pycnantha]|nr:hypothetical protein K1719_006255 [Acacia pycnantha]
MIFQKHPSLEQSSRLCSLTNIFNCFQVREMRYVAGEARRHKPGNSYSPIARELAKQRATDGAARAARGLLVNSE